LALSRAVFELTDEARNREELFIYPEGAGSPKRSLSILEASKLSRAEKLGEIYVMKDLEKDGFLIEQILCTTVIVVDSAKRKATNSGFARRKSVSGRHVNRSEGV